MNAQEKRILEGANRYAAMDRSDPFTKARCLAHIKSGIANVMIGGNNRPIDKFYNAKAQKVTHSITRADGSTLTWTTIEYIEGVRP